MSPNRFRLLVLPLILYAALFPVLAIDVVVRLIRRAPFFETGNLALLLFFETTRAFRSLLVLAVVLVLLGKATHRRYARAVILFLLFGIVAYSMAYAGSGYVGAFQEWLTGRLESAGLTRNHLLLLFGYFDWPLWLAVAALIRFAVLFPEPLTPADIEQSGASDRSGMMRGVPGAGLDIGNLARRTVAIAMRHGWLESGPVWAAGAAGAVASILLRQTPLRAVLWPLLLIGVGFAITAFRARFVTGDAEAKMRLNWLARGSLAALGFFVLGGLVSISNNPTAAIIGFVLLTIAPGIFLFGLCMAIYRRTR